MGATLSSRIQYASAASPDGADVKATQPHPKTSVSNHDLFYELVHLIDTLVAQHPVEAKAEFRRALSWTSPSLKPALFAAASGGTAGIWNIASGANIAMRASDGSPFFTLEVAGTSLGTGEPSYLAKVASFEYLQRVLKVADEMKLSEVGSAANPTPINTIFGIPGTISPSSVLIDAFEAYAAENDPKKKDANARLYKLLLILNAFDLDLLKSVVISQDQQCHNDIQKTTAEIQMLQSFISPDSAKSALKSIGWESSYTFANGCKAPPWRQVLGEIGYVEVLCVDIPDRVVITVTRDGFFVNGGFVADDRGMVTFELSVTYTVEGHEKLNYAKESDIFPSLVDLLRVKSTHFAAQIDNQDYLYQSETAAALGLTGTPIGAAAAAADPKESLDNVNNADDADSENDARGTGQAGVGANRKEVRKAGAMGKKKSKGGQKSKGTEPSLKWRALGLTEEGATLKSKKGKGIAGEEKKLSIDAHPSVRIRNATGGDETLSDSESEVSSDEEIQEKRTDNNELPAEYYQIQKLVKYLRCGNQTATIIAICSLRDFDLFNEFNQLAIRDVGGLDTLVNLLDTDDPKCKIGALKILKDISKNVQIRTAISNIDGMRPLVELLRDSDEEIKCLAAETIANCARNAHNRRAVRKYGGIKKLVRLLKVKPGSKEEVVAVSGALALATCSKSAKNKEAIQVAGSIPLLANLLESSNQNLLIPVVGILQECSSDENYRVAIRTSGMIKFLVENLSSSNEELQTHYETRNLVREYNGLQPLVNLLENPANKELLVAATVENVAAFNKLNTIKKLIGLMENQPEDVLVNVVGALGACAQTLEGRQGIRESGGITPLVNLLTGTNQALLVNVTTAVGACALDSDSMVIIDRLDGVRLLWSLLKSSNPQVQASAAWAISPCIEHAKDAGEMVRSFVGGLELIVSLLKSDQSEVLASVCAAIANIAKDEENLAVITDHGVVPMLGKLTTTRNDKLRKHLAEAIARCCHWGNNRVAFGAAGAVAPLVKYLKSPDLDVHTSTARALHQLSMDPDNCITMHENGVVQLLLGMVGSNDPELQEAAAGTIGNIRRLALASEKASMAP
ncbi:Armadillo repeat-containing protein 4 [Entophlyctis luteolus]|nr:Armadillo repeat-containing protein 4 [Entophlyctis luteolus]